MKTNLTQNMRFMNGEDQCRYEMHWVWTQPNKSNMRRRKRSNKNQKKI